MNRVARDFWAEVYDLRTAPTEDRRLRRTKAKKVLVRQPSSRSVR